MGTGYGVYLLDNRELSMVEVGHLKETSTPPSRETEVIILLLSAAVRID